MCLPLWSTTHCKRCLHSSTLWSLINEALWQCAPLQHDRLLQLISGVPHPAMVDWLLRGPPNSYLILLVLSVYKWAVTSRARNHRHCLKRALVRRSKPHWYRLIWPAPCILTYGRPLKINSWYTISVETRQLKCMWNFFYIFRSISTHTYKSRAKQIFF